MCGGRLGEPTRGGTLRRSRLRETARRSGLGEAVCGRRLGEPTRRPGVRRPATVRGRYRLRLPTRSALLRLGSRRGGTWDIGGAAPAAPVACGDRCPGRLCVVQRCRCRPPAAMPSHSPPQLPARSSRRSRSIPRVREEFTHRRGDRLRILHHRHVSRVRQRQEPRGTERPRGPRRHPVGHELIASTVDEERGREDTFGLTPQPMLPAQGVRVHHATRRTGHRVPEIRQLKPPLHLLHGGPVPLGSDPAGIPVTECCDAAHPLFGGPVLAEAGEERGHARYGKQCGRHRRALHADLGQRGRDEGEGADEIGPYGRDPRRDRPAEGVADEMDGPAARRVEVADDGAGVPGHRVVAVVRRRRVTEAGQVECLTVDDVLEERHQGRPVLRGAAEAVHVQGGRQSRAGAGAGADREREPRQADRVEPLALHDPDGARLGRRGCEGGRHARRLGRRHAGYVTRRSRTGSCVRRHRSHRAPFRCLLRSDLGTRPHEDARGHMREGSRHEGRPIRP